MVPARAPCGAFRVGLSAPQAASLRIVDASRGVARRRDGGRSAAPSFDRLRRAAPWAGRRRGGLGGGRASPAVVFV